jgi:transposase
MHDKYILLCRRADLTERQALILEAWTLNFPLLQIAYTLKEEFFDIWNAPDRNQAHNLYQVWPNRLPTELASAFHPLLTAMENWNQEIMAFFDHRLTNGPTEALGGLLKLAQRMGRGYSFEAIRAKVLLTGGLRKEVCPSFRGRLAQASP